MYLDTGEPEVSKLQRVGGVTLVILVAAASISSGGAASAAPTADILGAGAVGAVKDRYIVVLKDKKATAARVATEAKTLTGAYGGAVSHTYTATVRGYAAAMTEAQAKKVAADPDVAYVEQDSKVSKHDTQPDPPSWGLDRVDQQWLPFDKSYTYPTAAANVHAYVLDTGIYIGHQQFGGRAGYGYDAVKIDERIRDGDDIPEDCDGHGTHVSGTIGGRDYGVAKGVRLVAVQVIDCQGGGYTSEIIAGVDWVTANAVRPAVANMSLGIKEPASELAALDAAVRASIASGITYAVSAGNGDLTGHPLEACTQSPARVPEAITVGATDEADFRLTSTNYGTCVDIFAPGHQIASSVPGSDTAVDRYTGTSMASPHAAGAAALLLSANPGWTPEQVRNRMVGEATRAAVRNARSTDRLLRIGSSLPPTTGLRAMANNKVVTTPSAGASPLIASAGVVNTWEQLDLVDAGTGYIAFRARSNGKYVSAESAGTKPLIASRPAIGDWERFELVDNSDGTISFKAKANGNYVSAESAGTRPLIASRPAIGTWEKFTWASPVSVISLRANANGKLVSAEGAGTKPLIASRTAIGTWERFDMIDLGNDAVALRAHANGRYVTAESAGAEPLIASRTAIASWQIFYLDHQGVGIALRSDANGRFVTAGNAGTSPLIANRTETAEWEWFSYQ